MSIVQIGNIGFEPTGTRLSFSCAENGPWVVEMDGTTGVFLKKVRIKIAFSGAALARLNDPNDIGDQFTHPLCLVKSSDRVKEFLAGYSAQFGTKLLAAVKNMQHFVVIGHDMSVGILARDVSITYE
jgi:hypothetical protein